MPVIRPEVVALVAAVASILVQALKGPVPESAKRWLPLILLAFLTAGGVGLAAAYGYDLLAGGLEGFFGGASSLGFYAVASSLPGVRDVFNTDGWIAPSYD